MSAANPALRRDGKPDGRATRWLDKTPEERRAAVAAANAGARRAALDTRIDRLVAEAPPLSEDQKAKLAVLLNGGQ